jgi:hypothetical protein
MSGVPPLEMRSQARPDAASACRVGHQPTEGEATGLVDLSCQRNRFVSRLHAAAAHAGVAFDQHLQTMAGVGEGRRQPFQCVHTVRRHRQGDTAMQRQKPLQLGASENVVREKNVGQPGVGHHLGLADLLAGDADRTRRHLLLRPVGQFVRLDVWPELQPVLVGMGLGTGNVGFGACGVDQDRWRVEVVDGRHQLSLCGNPQRL